MAQLTRKYKTTFTNYPAEFTVVYYNGSFKRIIHDKGQIADKLWQSLTKAIPRDESAIRAFNKKFAGKLKIERITKDTDKDVTLYTLFLKSYWSFYLDKSEGKKPIMTNVEGANLKKIVAYFQENTKDDQQALLEWEAILRDWSKLTAFYQSQVKISQIYGNLSNILIQFKGNKNTISKGFDEVEMPTDKDF